jgi:protein O-mannosyl-transferase
LFFVICKPAGVKKKSLLNIAAVTGITILGVLIYSNSFDCSFHYDDLNNFVNNPRLHHLSDVRNWWTFQSNRVVGMFTLVMNYHFSQDKVWSYHLVNLVIHLVNALLVWWLTMMVYATPAMKGLEVSRNKRIIAFFTALMFISHPLQTQAVTYIIQRLASLVALFYILSLVLYVKGRLLNKGDWRKFLLFGGSFLSALLAIRTKENAFTLPFVILLFEIMFLQKNLSKIRFKDYRVIILMIAVLCIIVTIPFIVSMSVFNTLPPSEGHTYTLTPWTYLFTQFRVIVTYIRLLIVPVNQAVDYDFRISESFFEGMTILCFLLLAALVTAAIFFYKKHRVIAFGIFWFFLTLLIESSIIPISDVIFEHRVYLPSVGFFLIVTYLGFLLLKGRNRWLAISLLTLFVVVNSFLTYERNKVWKTDLSLWKDNVRKFPDCARPLNNLGKAQCDAGDLEGGLENYNKAILMAPQYSLAYFNRGVSRNFLQDYQGAISDYNKALELDPGNLTIYVNRGTVKTSIQDNKGALEDFRHAIALDPGNIDIYFNCAIAAQNLGDLTGAMKYLDEAIAKKPGFAMAYMKMGIIKNLANDPGGAIESLNMAIKLDPGMTDAYKNRGLIFLHQGKYTDALLDFNKTLQLQPDFAEVWFMKGEAYLRMKNQREALTNYTKAIELKPGFYDALMEKAMVEFNMKDYRHAIEDLTAAIAANPQSGQAYKDRGSNKYYMKDQKGACLDWKKAAELGNRDVLQYLQTLCK